MLDEIDTITGQLVISARSLEQYGCSGEYTDEQTIAAVRRYRNLTRRVLGRSQTMSQVGGDRREDAGAIAPVPAMAEPTAATSALTLKPAVLIATSGGGPGEFELRDSVHGNSPEIPMAILQNMHAKDDKYE